MTSFTNLIKPDSTELERYFLSVYTGHLWDALDKIKDWHSPEHIEKEVQMKLLKIQQQALPKTVVDFQGELEDLIDDILDDDVSDSAFDGKKYKFIEKYAPQALPVVPDFVAEWIECVKGKNNNALALLDDDNMPDDVNDWLFFQRNDDNINLILRAWLDGYTVEKPQLFYLKHIDMSETDKKFDHYLIKTREGGFISSGFNHSKSHKGQLPDFNDCFEFTQSEINSMQTGSYEQIEVAE